MRSLKVVFAGTPEFAAEILSMIIEAKYEVVLVMTQPDRPGGRGLKLQQSPVKQTALYHQIPVLQPHSLKLDSKYSEEAFYAKQVLETSTFDVIVVAELITSSTTF
jgi:methionyl-tRNA formyltransferase